MEPSYSDKIALIESKGCICDVCDFYPSFCSGEGGVRGGPNGPIYPPCADKDSYDYLNQDKVEQVYNELVEEEGE